jgi:CheY-like chemotaxis protein
MTILVVDDEPTMPRLFDQRYRKEIRDGLLAFRYAASGEEALVALDQEGDRIALVLSDINMPGMTGLDLLDALRQRGFTKPVFMISAYDGSDYEVQALEKGARGFLPKPMRFDDLNALIRSLKENA